jgi:hypothetical protein
MRRREPPFIGGEEGIPYNISILLCIEDLRATTIKEQSRRHEKVNP